MIYTVGYAKLDHPRLRRLLRALRAQHLVDVRSIPTSRRPGFGRHQLAAAFPEYTWQGQWLGGIKPGKPGTTPEGLHWLSSQIDCNPLIMCLEEPPADCHRHALIARPLLKRGIDCIHVYQNELIEASELQRSLDDDDEYDYTELYY